MTRITGKEEWVFEGKAGVPPVRELVERSRRQRAFYVRQLRRYRWHNGTKTPLAERVRIQQCYDAPGDKLAERARALRFVWVDLETVGLAPPWGDAKPGADVGPGQYVVHIQGAPKRG